MYHTPLSQGDRHPSIPYSSDYPPSISQSMVSQHDQPSFGYEGNLLSAPSSNLIPPSPSSGVPYRLDGNRFNLDANVNIPMPQSHMPQQLPFPNYVFRKDPISAHLTSDELNQPSSLRSREFNQNQQFSRNHHQLPPPPHHAETDIPNRAHSSIYSSHNQLPIYNDNFSPDDYSSVYPNPVRSCFSHPPRTPVDLSPPSTDDSELSRMESSRQVNEISLMSTLYSRGSDNHSEAS